MAEIIKVTDMRTLKLGDVVRLPNATVTKFDPLDGAVLIEFDGGEDVWIQPNCIAGIEVTREEESEFTLTWNRAVAAMFRGNGSVVCEDGSFRARYRIHQGQLQAFFRGEWLNVAQVDDYFYDDKFRIVEEA